MVFISKCQAILLPILPSLVWCGENMIVRARTHDLPVTTALTFVWANNVMWALLTMGLLLNLIPIEHVYENLSCNKNANASFSIASTALFLESQHINYTEVLGWSYTCIHIMNTRIKKKVRLYCYPRLFVCLFDSARHIFLSLILRESKNNLFVLRGDALEGFRCCTLTYTFLIGGIVNFFTVR